jgi:flagellar motor switch protein FliM
LELNLGMRAVQAVVNSLQEGLRPVLPLESATFQSIPANEAEKTFASWEAILKIPFHVKVEDEQRELWLAFPYNTVRHLLLRTVKGAPAEAGENQPYLEQHLEQVSLSLPLYLGGAELTFQELMDLEKGDVIRLDSTMDQTFRLSLGNQIAFRGKVGGFRGRYAFHVEEVQQTD